MTKLHIDCVRTECTSTPKHGCFNLCVKRHETSQNCTPGGRCKRKPRGVPEYERLFPGENADYNARGLSFSPGFRISPMFLGAKAKLAEQLSGLFQGVCINSVVTHSKGCTRFWTCTSACGLPPSPSCAFEKPTLCDPTVGSQKPSKSPTRASMRSVP